MMDEPQKIAKMHLRGVFHQFGSSVLGHPISLRIMMRMDRALIRLSLRGQRRPSSLNVILNSPGSGNIGDQAMFESFASNMTGRILAIVKASDAYALPDNETSGRVSFLVLPNLVYSKFLSHYRDIWRLGRAIRDASSFSVMGADIMDGGYGTYSSVVEWNLARSIHESGIPARVLGFSWNGRAPREVIEFARAAGDSGVKILSRDPDSHTRLLSDGVANVVQSSDMVFSLSGDQPSVPMPPIAGLENLVTKLAVVNISGLIGTSVRQEHEYDNILETLEDLGYTCLLLPHVSHSNVNDITAIARLRSESPAAQRAIFVERLLTPTDVLSIVSKADVVVTGRMHLSILALLAGRPVITLATQGKVSGLMKLFSIPDHCIDPTEGFGQRVSELLLKIESDRPELVEKVRSNLTAVRVLSAKNFEPLNAR